MNGEWCITQIIYKIFEIILIILIISVRSHSQTWEWDQGFGNGFGNGGEFGNGNGRIFDGNFVNGHSHSQPILEWPFTNSGSLAQRLLVCEWLFQNGPFTNFSLTIQGVFPFNSLWYVNGHSRMGHSQTFVNGNGRIWALIFVNGLWMGRMGMAIPIHKSLWMGMAIPEWLRTLLIIL